MKRKTIPLILTLPALLLLSACASSMNIGSSELSCGNPQRGTPCIGMRAAWAAGNDYRPEDGAVSTIGGAAANGRSGGITPFLPEPVPNMAVLSEPKPVLMPAQVLRVWVNAYQDDRGDLVYPSRVFTEVTPRRWNVGYAATQGIQSARKVTPLVVATPVPDTPVQAGVTAGNARGAVDEGNSNTVPAASVLNTLPPGVLPPLQ